MTEKIKQQVLEEIYDYLKEHIEDFDLEAQLALRKMDHCRAPLNSINSSLCRQMEDYMEEWLHNEIETEELLVVEKSSQEGPSVFDNINSEGPGMKKKYRITCKTDPYHASRSARHKGCKILERDGATPVKWVHDDYFGLGYTLKEVRQALMSLAYEDAERSGEKIRHKYFSMYYESDVFTYAAEEF